MELLIIDLYSDLLPHIPRKSEYFHYNQVLEHPQSVLKFKFLLLAFCAKTSALWYEPRSVMGISQRFDKHCCCHPQGEYVLVDRVTWALPTNHQSTFSP
jgi:hypothetical protein